MRSTALAKIRCWVQPWTSPPNLMWSGYGVEVELGGALGLVPRLADQYGVFRHEGGRFSFSERSENQPDRRRTDRL